MLTGGNSMRAGRDRAEAVDLDDTVAAHLAFQQTPTNEATNLEVGAK